MADERPRLYEYRLRRVELPDPRRPEELRPALELVIRGDYFHVGATPIRVYVGGLQVAPHEVSPDGTLLTVFMFEQPPEGAPIVVEQGSFLLEAPERFTIERLERRPPRQREG
jgi:hypothetical protein